MRLLVERAGILREEVVLEVGPGTGSLTEMLLERAAHVVCVEIDRGLATLVAERFAGRDNLTVLHTDVLASKHAVHPSVIEALQARTTEASGRYRLVSNLPYNIATPLLIDLLLGEPALTAAHFTVQKEVGLRLLAEAGREEYGPLSVIVQAGARVRRLAAVPATAFWPQPKVESVMIELTSRERNRDELRRLAQLVRAGFAHRRKTLRHNLHDLAGREVVEGIERHGALDFGRRPETLALDEWESLAAEPALAAALRA